MNARARAHHDLGSRRIDDVRLGGHGEELVGQTLQDERRDVVRPAGAVVYSVAFSDNNLILTESSSGYAELWQTSL